MAKFDKTQTAAEYLHSIVDPSGVVGPEWYADEIARTAQIMASDRMSPNERTQQWRAEYIKALTDDLLVVKGIKQEESSCPA